VSGFFGATYNCTQKFISSNNLVYVKEGQKVKQGNTRTYFFIKKQLYLCIEIQNQYF
jgi:hypothetical protein